MKKKQFIAGFNIPTIIRKHVENNPAQYTIGIYTIGRINFDRRPQINEMLQNLEEHVDLEAYNCYKNLLNNKKYHAATDLVKLYSRRNSTQSTAWIVEIQAAAVSVLTLLGKTYKALEDYRDLADPILSQAEAIVETFPSEDPMRALLWSAFVNAGATFQKQSVGEEAINESIRLSFEGFL